MSINQRNYYDFSNRLTYADNPRDIWEVEFFLSFINQPKSKKVVLELGSGIGRYTLDLLNKGYEVHAVEISENNCKLLVQNIRTKGTRDNMRYKIYNDDFTNIKFDRKYDLIFCVNTLHHIAPIKQTLNKLCELLKEGGQLLLIEPNPLNLFYYIYFIMNNNWEVEKGILECLPHRIVEIIKKNELFVKPVSSYNLLPQRISTNIFYWRFNLAIGSLPILETFALTKIYNAFKEKVHK